jgi:SAM-dependent methyltransferase
MNPREHARLAEHEEWYWWHRARERVVHRILRRVAPPNARILDVGCGTGATSASLRRFGPVLGMDVGSEALSRARQRGLLVTRSSATRLPVRGGAFDVVVALDVLEHLDDDAAALREIREALEPGGALLATVPAYPFLWSSHDVALGHRRRYLRRQLIERLRDTGFELELCSYVMSSILPAAMAMRLAERLLPAGRRKSQSGYVPLPAPLNGLLTRLAAFEGYLLRWLRLPFGLSIVALARRPRLSRSDNGSRS